MLRLARSAFGLILLAGMLLLGACDGLFTGTQVVRFPLAPGAGGGYAPVKLALGPEMNPIALNFAAEYTINPAESGQWNAYVAVLTFQGKAIASNQFNINNATSPEAPGGAPSVAHTMMQVEVAETGDYELRISPTAPIRVTLANPNVELRRNVRPAAR